MCILGRGAAFFHRICESLPGIVTSYGVNLLKPKVCNNLRLIAANFTKNIQDRDWTMVKNLWRLQRCASKNASVTGRKLFQVLPYFLLNTDVKLLFRNLRLRYCVILSANDLFYGV